jgi:AraC family transcriptional activator of tynA and feaB
MFERWSTVHNAAPQRAEVWREAFLSMTPRIERLAGSRAMLLHRGLDRLAPNNVEAPPHGVESTPLVPANRGRAYLFVNLRLSGRCRLRQCGRELIARPGQLLLIDSSEPYELQQPDEVDVLSLAVPQPMLGKLLPAATDQVACRLPESASAMLLVNQLRTLAQWPHELSAAEADRVSDLLVGMVCAVIAAAAQAPNAPGARHLQPKVPSLIE